MKRIAVTYSPFGIARSCIFTDTASGWNFVLALLDNEVCFQVQFV